MNVKQVENSIQLGISCDLCETSDFFGSRFKCNICENYDLCFNCYKKIIAENSLHSHTPINFRCINKIFHQDLLIQVKEFQKSLRMGTDTITTNLLTSIIEKSQKLSEKATLFDSDCRFLMGNLYLVLNGNIYECLNQYFIAESICENIKDDYETSFLKYRIGQFYLVQNTSEVAEILPNANKTAEKYLLESLEIARKISSNYLKLLSLKSLGDMYKKYNPNKYLECLLEAHDVCSFFQNQKICGKICKEIGDYYFKRNFFNKSLTYYEESKKINKKTNNLTDLNICNVFIGKIYGRLKKFELSVKFLTESYEYFKNKNDDTFKRIVKLLYLEIGENHLNLRNYEKAIEFYKLYLTVSPHDEKRIGFKISRILSLSKVLKEIGQNTSIEYLRNSLNFFTVTHFRYELDEELKNLKETRELLMCTVQKVYLKNVIEFNLCLEFVERFKLFLDNIEKIKKMVLFPELRLIECVIYEEIILLELLKINNVNSLEINKEIRRIETELKSDTKNPKEILYLKLGKLYFKVNNFKKSSENLQLSIEEDSEFIGNEEKSNIFNLFGKVLMFEQEYNHSLHFYKKGLKLTKNDALKCEIMNNISLLFYVQKLYPESLKYLNNSLIITRNQKKEQSFKVIHGITLRNFGIYYFRLKKYDKSLEYLNQSQLVFQNLNHPNNLFLIYLILGDIYFFRENIRKSIFYLNKSLNYANKIEKNIFLKTILSLKKGLFYQKLNLLNISKGILLVSVDLSKKIENEKISKILLWNILLVLGIIHNKKKQYSRSLDCVNEVEKLKKYVDVYKQSEILILKGINLFREMKYKDSFMVTIDLKKILIKIKDEKEKKKFEGVLWSLVSSFLFIKSKDEDVKKNFQNSLLCFELTNDLENQFNTASNLGIACNSKSQELKIFEKTFLIFRKIVENYENYLFFINKGAYLPSLERIICYNRKNKLLKKNFIIIETIKSIELLIKMRFNFFKKKFVKKIVNINFKFPNIQSVHFFIMKEKKDLLFYVTEKSSKGSSPKIKYVECEDFDFNRVNDLIKQFYSLIENFYKLGIKFNFINKEELVNMTENQKQSVENMKKKCKELCTKLFRVVYWNKIERYLNKKDVVYIFGHSILNYIPFNCLFNESKKKYLFEDYQFVYNYSMCLYNLISSFSENRVKKKNKINGLFLGNRVSEDNENSVVKMISRIKKSVSKNQKSNKSIVLENEDLNLSQIKRVLKKNTPNFIYFETDFTLKNIPAIDPLALSCKILLSQNDVLKLSYLEEKIPLSGVKFVFFAGNSVDSTIPFLLSKRLFEGIIQKGVNFVISNLSKVDQDINYFFAKNYFQNYLTKKTELESIRKAIIDLKKYDFINDLPFLWGLFTIHGCPK